jgi:hypothetical protein
VLDAALDPASALENEAIREAVEAPAAASAAAVLAAPGE